MHAPGKVCWVSNLAEVSEKPMSMSACEKSMLVFLNVALSLYYR